MKKTAFLCLLFFLAAACGAEDLRLKNGRYIRKVEIISATQGLVEVAVEGEAYFIPKNQTAGLV